MALTSMMKLYGYWRSGTSHRVRLALGAKGLPFEQVPVDLRAAAHREDAFAALNPSKALPVLVLPDGTHLSQSGAILEYLEERYPQPSLLPPGAKARAQVRMLCDIVGRDIHPLQNLRVQKFLKEDFDLPQTDIQAWLERFIGDGLAAYEATVRRIERRQGFSVGRAFSFAECYLLPQLYAARRFGLSLDPYPTLVEIEEAASALPFVADAAPEAQGDAPGMG